MIDIAQLIADTADPKLATAGRLARARALGDVVDSNSLAGLIRLASDDSLPNAVSREVGRSVARVAAALDSTLEVSNEKSVQFTEDAYLGFDAETAILMWTEEGSASR